MKLSIIIPIFNEERKIKQDILAADVFLKENKIGEILQKRNFNATTLKAFVDEYMPLHLVNSKEVFRENIETLDESTLQLIEL